VDQLGRWLATFSHDPLTMILAVTVVTIFTSEIMSNVAQVIIFAPVVTSLAVALKIDPLVLGMPMTLAASCAGMLPMGTPPNAIVFASGRIRLGQMAKAGLVMNFVAILVITVFCRFVLPWIR
jgi:solute carrier family 13 (sodium-dependent dicarboxylate transporter), member 2/3/5